MKQVCKAFLLVFLGLYGVAQESPAPRVAIPLIANDSHHRPIIVTLESLVITDQKTPVTGARLLRGADLPLELGMLVDASGSQRASHLDDFVSASKHLADEIIHGPEDRVFFLSFSINARASAWLNKEQLQGTTAKVEIGGGTALYDALGMACKQRMGPRDWRKPTRRVLVLISDGDDNLSHITRDDAAAEALKAGVVIFTINPKSSFVSFNGDHGEKVMEDFSKLTGGESFSRLSRQDIPKAFASIKELIDGLYYLSYVPPDAAKSAVHAIEVKPAPKKKFELSYARKYLWNP